MPLTWRPKPAGLSERDARRWALLMITCQTAVVGRSTIASLGAGRYRLVVDNGHDRPSFPCWIGDDEQPGCPDILTCGNTLWKRKR